MPVPGQIVLLSLLCLKYPKVMLFVSKNKASGADTKDARFCVFVLLEPRIKARPPHCSRSTDIWGAASYVFSRKHCVQSNWVILF